jgi:hypothetical protein
MQWRRLDQTNLSVSQGFVEQIDMLLSFSIAMIRSAGAILLANRVAHLTWLNCPADQWFTEVIGGELVRSLSSCCGTLIQTIVVPLSES